MYTLEDTYQGKREKVGSHGNKSNHNRDKAYVVTVLDLGQFGTGFATILLPCDAKCSAERKTKIEREQAMENKTILERAREIYNSYPGNTWNPPAEVSAV